MTGGLRLRRLDGRLSGQTHPITRDVITLGTHPASDIRVAGDESPTVAPRHAALIKGDSGWVVRHLEGSTGTWINGVQIRRERRIAPGDTLRLGEAGPEFLFEAAEAAPLAGPLRRGRPVRRALLVSGIMAALITAWLIWHRAGPLTDGRQLLLAQVDSLTDLLRATAARESTLSERLDEAVAEAGRTRSLLTGPAVPEADLDSLTRRVEQLRDAQGGLLRAAAFDARVVVAANRDAVALLLVEHQDRSTVAGTAVAVYRSGDTSWVATSRHLVVDSAGQPARRLGLAFDGTAQVFEALLVGSDPDHDLALLRVIIRGGTPVIPATAAAPLPGTPLAVITFPIGLDPGASEDWRAVGAVASAFTATVSQATPQRLVLDGYGSPGMSGSPVLNGVGEIVGIIYGGPAGSGNRLVFAVPGEALASLLARVRPR